MTKEDQWFTEHSLEISQQYRGEHIAIVEDKIVAHGEDFKKVAEEARKISQNPLFVEIPKEDVVVYADRIHL